MSDVPNAKALALTQAVKEEAHRLGFQLAGVTSPETPAHWTMYEHWLAQGRHGDMGYLATDTARQRRGNPRLILPECQSILVLGIRYPASTSALLPTAYPAGRVASYAWGSDYHHVLPARLKAIVTFIKAWVGREIPNRWYTDTGPILERELAQRAGLGWIGKNTCLIHPALGSYFFLAEILLGIELVLDQPFRYDHCGACTRCLEACPTGCILPDRTIDARRCIAYLTIEQKGVIPPSLRPFLGDWVFGCDVCQQVCPWNIRFGAQPHDPEFAPRPGFPLLDLESVLLLERQGFSQKFKGSPLKRAKRSGILRNAVVALGNQASPKALSALAEVLQHDPDPWVRRHAAWALGQIKDEAALRVLHQASMREADPAVIEEIQRAAS